MDDTKVRSHKRKGAARSEQERSHKRRATVFDAVAGRIGYESSLSSDTFSKYRDTTSSSKQAVAPEEVLFRRKGAPQRYEENDRYFANERLRPDQTLPDSDLLKHLHAYASNFYSHATASRGQSDWRSIDETGLLALGILVEEAAAQALGPTGDLAFVEGDDADSGPCGRRFWNGECWTRSVIARRRRRARGQQGLSSVQPEPGVAEDARAGNTRAEEADSSDQT